MKVWTIVGYQYDGAIYCPEHILEALPTGEGEAYDGWKDVSGQPVEASLSELAYAFQIDRMDERSFDSGDFPKVIFSSDTTEDDTCDTCGVEL